MLLAALLVIFWSVRTLILGFKTGKMSDEILLLFNDADKAEAPLAFWLYALYHFAIVITILSILGLAVHRGAG